MTIQELYDLFILEQQYRNNTSVTIDWYKVQLHDFFRWLDSNETEALTILNFKKYGVYLRSLTKRNGEKLSGSSIHGALRAVKTFYNFCIGEEYIMDISRQLKLPKVRSKEKLILDDEEIRQLMSCFGDDAISIRNKCFVALMLDSGLRRGEIPRINVGDVDLRNNTILVRGKGIKQRIVPIGDTSYALLHRYLTRCRPIATSAADPFFVDRFRNRCTDNLIKLVFQDLKSTSGIERLHPHLLRHTFATYYLADGGDLETLRLILGHTDIQTTQTYLHLAFNLKLARSRHNSHLDSLSAEQL